MGNLLGAGLREDAAALKLSGELVAKLRERFDLISDSLGLDRSQVQELFRAKPAELDLIFQLFDPQNRGRIDAFEFISGMILISDATLDDKSIMLFDQFDFDHSLNISFPELMILMRSSMCALAYMTGSEVMSMEELEAHVNQVLGKVDTNHDGIVSLDEFQSFVTKDADAIKVLNGLKLITADDKKMNFGSDENPEVDSDLENEVARDYNRSLVHERVKDGVETLDDTDFLMEEVGAGDQFMAVKPWVGTVNASVPTGYKKKRGDDDPPDATLELEYVHGYRCHDVRNNLRYTASGEVVYHTAAVGIVLNPATNTQKFLMGHTDDITSFSYTPRGNLVCTGEVGRFPLLTVWNCDTMEIVKSYKGLLKKGVSYVSFSADGSKVAAFAADEDHTVAVFETGGRPGKPGPMAGVYASGSAGKDTILAIEYHPSSNDQIIACGVKAYLILDIANGVVKTSRGIGWGKTPNTQLQALVCIGFVGSTVLTGATNGCVFKWTGKSLTSATKIHEGAVLCIGPRAAGQGVVTGGNDGFVHVLDLSLNKVLSVDLKTPKFASMLPKARSVCEGAGGKLLIGTRGGEIYESAGATVKCFMRGHFDKELWGICAHPSRNEFATVGQDTLLGIWDVATRKQKANFKLPGMATCCRYSPDGTSLAVGFQSGLVAIYDPASMAVKKQMKDRVLAITIIQFTPSGDVMAVGAHDSEIFSYLVRQNYKLQFKMRGHHSNVYALDFSVQGNVVQSNCTSYELLFHNMATGKIDPSGASANKDEKWASWTCKIGWPTQGVWPPYSDGSDINAVERSKSAAVVATVDDFGKVKLFKYPCVNKGAGCNTYSGHSSHVTNLSFTTTGYLMSTGGNDKAIFQWKYAEEREAAGGTIDEATMQAFQESEASDAPFQLESAGEGDQFMAVKPWLGEVIHSAPNGYKPPANQKTAPEANLTLQRVHGYRGFDSRNNLKYLASGKMVYNAAALGIVLDKESRQQQFFNFHDDDVVSLAIHPQREIVATGQMTHVGKTRELPIYVWNATTFQVLVCLKSSNRRAIRVLEFSPDGKDLLSVGEDDDHTLVIYDWQANRIKCSVKVDKDAIVGSVYISPTELALYGAKLIKFFTINGQNATGTRGSVGNATKPFEPLMCGAKLRNTILTGTFQGNIWVWNGKSLGKSLKAHNGPVTAIYTDETRIITGGGDGSVILWDPQFVKKQTFSLTEYSLGPAPRSIDVSPSDPNTLLIGTRGCEIIEIQAWRTAETYINGHFNGELWGLCLHPQEPMCATCGGDKTIRIWHLQEGNMVLAIKPLPQDLRAMDWSLDGNYIVAGLMNGVVMLLDASTLSTLSTHQSSFKGKDCWIEDIKFSPNGQFVAFGAHGGASKVEIVKIQGTKLVKGWIINAGLTSALTHLDWSVTSSLLAVNSQAYELKFVNVEGKSNVASSSVKAEEWATWTCVLGWPVQYIWPEFADGTDINACMRSRNGQLLATADDFGKVNLFRWPVVVKKQQSKTFLGHSSHVTKVKFSQGDQYVVSTGGNDKCVFVWTTDIAGSDPTEGADMSEVSAAEQSEFGQAPKAPRPHEEAREQTKKKVNAAMESNDMGNFFEMEELGEGDQFMAVKPWIGALKAPSSYVKPARNQDLPPSITLTLEWVHGYRAKDCRTNLRYLPDGRIIYHAAALGIVYEKQAHAQSFFIRHVDDITAFALNPEGRIAATGEVGRYPNIHVWDPVSMNTLFSYKGKELQNGISALGFSPSGALLAAAAMDDNHCLGIFDVSGRVLTCSVKGGQEVVSSLGFLNETTVVTVGLKHYKIWTIAGKTATAKRGSFGTFNNLLLCMGIHGQDVFTGAGDGSIVKWSGISAIKAFPVHQRAVDSIWCGPNKVVSGGKDAKINIMDYNMRVEKTIDMSQRGYDCVSGMVRSAILDSNESTLLVGTYGSEIFEISVQTPTQATCFVKGHFTPSRGNTVTNEVWGLAVLDDTKYTTSSDDGTLRVWDLAAKRQISYVRFDPAEQVPVGAMARSLAASSDGTMLAVGFKDGSFKLLDTNTWSVRQQKKERNEEISDIKFSPGGDKLAVGSHDNFVDIYTVPGLKRKGVCKGHSSFITHLDWSVDGSALHTNCGAYELLFWNGDTGAQVTGGATAYKDEEWASWTLVIGWPVQGIYPPVSDGTDINAVCRSVQKFGNDEYQLIATADDFGLVKVYRYPCLKKGAQGVLGKGHSSHVTNLRFTPNGQYLISTGGDDQCVMQWRVENKLS